MQPESRKWRRREPRLVIAIAAALLAQAAVGVLFWRAAAWQSHKKTGAKVQPKPGQSGERPAPPQRPVYPLLAALVPLVAWGAALKMTRKVRTTDAIVDALDSWDDRERGPEPGLAVLEIGWRRTDGAPSAGSSPPLVPTAQFVATGNQHCPHSEELPLAPHRPRRRISEVFPPPPEQRRPRPRRPMPRSCDQPTPPARSPVSCLLPRETARQSGRHP
jgi:hypothetical protein